jgi:hypothetical protein
MKHEYNRTEERLLKIIPQDGQRITTDALTKKFYQLGRRDVPKNGQQMIANAMRSLADKVKKNREAFKLKRTAEQRPTQFWIE